MIEFFVSYRSADEPYAAELIAQALGDRFGQERVFLDTNSIPAGEHFPKEIWTALQSCRILLAVIGTRWLQRDEMGRRRIDEPADYVRREIETALRRNVAVIPVLVGGATSPTAADLPAGIALLAERQSVALRSRGASADIDRLVDDLARTDGGRSRDISQAAGRPRSPEPTVNNTFHGPVDAGTIGISHTSRGADDRSRW